MPANPVSLDELRDGFLLLFGGEALRLGRAIGQIEQGGGELSFGKGGGESDPSVPVPMPVSLRGCRGRLRVGARLQDLGPGLRKGHAGKLREVALPRLVYGLRVVAPALVLILDEHLVDAEIAVELHDLLQEEPPWAAGGGK